jgi:hypothetical protein
MTSLSENTVVTTSGGLVELGYSQITSNVTINSTTAGSGNEVIAPLTVVCDGDLVIVEFFANNTRPAVSSAASLTISLYQDNVEIIRQWGFQNTSGTNGANAPTHLVARLTPSAGVHTFSVKAWGSSSGGIVAAGTGTGTTSAPAFLRVSKILQASQFIVPLASAPLVTSLPSAPIVGQEVRYVADATNGVYWNLHYDGLGTYPWKFIGGRELTSMVLANQGVGLTTNTYIDLGTVGPQITVPLAGDYRIEWGSNASLNAGVSTVAGMGIKFGSASAPANANPETRWVAHIGQPTTSGGAIRAAISNFDIATDVAASTLIKAQYFHNNGNIAAFAYRSLSIVPIRVKAP